MSLSKKKPSPSFRMRQWSLQEAKAKLSQLVKDASLEPQVICVHGKGKVVVLDMLTFEKIKQSQQSFVDFMRTSPLADMELNFERDSQPARKLEIL